VFVKLIRNLLPVTGTGNYILLVFSSKVKSIHKQQTTRRKPIECAPEASRGGREWAEMTEGVHLEVTRHKC